MLLITKSDIEASEDAAALCFVLCMYCYVCTMHFSEHGDILIMVLTRSD